MVLFSTDPSQAAPFLITVIISMFGWVEDLLGKLHSSLLSPKESFIDDSFW
jgi:hypothetical protein